MEKQDIIAAIRKAKGSKKRNFKQKFDLIITLKDIDLKKPDNQVELFIPLHFSKGKISRICALVGPELASSAKEGCDFVISADEFDKYNDKKALKRLSREYDFFIAQATIMPRVATVFGRVLGSRGKMPNPKAGCVVPSTANLKALNEKLQKLVRISAKTNAAIQTIVGNEDMPEEEIADNALTVYNALLQALPSERHNIKGVFVKLTMGNPVRVSEKEAGEKRIAKTKKKAGKGVTEEKETEEGGVESAASD